MKNLTVEQRLAALEKRVNELALLLTSGGRVKDWRRTVGMFSGDEVMKRIDEEALKFRERDREKARRKEARRKQAKRQKVKA